MSRINEESFRKKYYEINRSNADGAADSGFATDAEDLGSGLNAERAAFCEKENLPEFKNFLGKRVDGENVDNGCIAVLSTATLRRWIDAGKYRSDELSKKKLVESGLVDPLADGFMVYDDDVLPYSLFHGDDVGCTYVLNDADESVTLQIIDPETFFFALPFATASFNGECDSDGADDERTVTEDFSAEKYAAEEYTAEEKEERTPEEKTGKKNYPALEKPTMVIVVDTVNSGSLIGALRNTCDGKPLNDWFDFLFPRGWSDESGLRSKFFISLIDGRALKVVESRVTPYAYCDKQSTLVSRLSSLWMNGFADPDKKWINVARENANELFGRNANQTLVLITDAEQNFTDEDDEWFGELRNDVKTFVIGVGSAGAKAALALDPDESRSFAGVPSKEDLKKAFEAVVRMTEIR